MSEHIQPIMARLDPLYRVGRVWSYAESCLLLDIIRNPNHMAEVETVVSYHASLPPHERRFFPHTMRRLLEDWNETLDKIAASKHFGEAPMAMSQAERISMESERKRIAERLAVIKGQASHTATGFTYDDKQRAERTKLLARDTELKQRLGQTI